MRIGGHRARTTQKAPLNKKVEIRNNADLQAFMHDPIGIITQKTFGTERTSTADLLRKPISVKYVLDEYFETHWYIDR